MTILESRSVTCPPAGEMVSPSVLSFIDTGLISLTFTVSIAMIGMGKTLTRFYFEAFSFCPMTNEIEQFPVAKASIESLMSVCLSITKIPQSLRIVPINHIAY